jgi:hypothetical protein
VSMSGFVDVETLWCSRCWLNLGDHDQGNVFWMVARPKEHGLEQTLLAHVQEENDLGID